MILSQDVGIVLLIYSPNIGLFGGSADEKVHFEGNWRSAFRVLREESRICDLKIAQKNSIYDMRGVSNVIQHAAASALHLHLIS